MKIIQYKSSLKNAIIDALMNLQKHECGLSNTRRILSRKMCSEYFEEMIKGRVFVAMNLDAFVGFVAYKFQQEEVIFETDDSNNYALISDIYVGEEYRNEGLAQLLLDAVFDDLRLNRFSGRARICSLHNNNMAIGAYKKYGFAPYEIIFEKKI